MKTIKIMKWNWRNQAWKKKIWKICQGKTNKLIYIYLSLLIQVRLLFNCDSISKVIFNQSFKILFLVHICRVVDSIILISPAPLIGLKWIYSVICKSCDNKIISKP